VNALQEFIDAEMRARDWKQADLSRASGLTTAHISKMLRPGQRVAQMPDDETIAGLAGAFRTGEDVVRRVALEAMGIDLAPLHITRTVTDASDDELLAELTRRLQATALRRKRSPVRLMRPESAAARRDKTAPKADA
jgi:transcriptional regulator with XRE-family HTH domain